MSALAMSFKKSAAELKNIKCIAVTGMLIAIAIVLRSIAIQITPDLRIVFSFLAIITIAMLFGPVVAAPAALLTDFIGFLFAANYPHEVASKGGRDLYHFFQRLIFRSIG